MKWVFNHSARKSIPPISLDSHGEWPGAHVPVASCPTPPLRLTTVIQRAENKEKFSDDFLTPSNTPPSIAFLLPLHYSLIVAERNEAWGASTQEVKKQLLVLSDKSLNISTSYAPMLFNPDFMHA